MCSCFVAADGLQIHCVLFYSMMNRKSSKYYFLFSVQVFLLPVGQASFKCICWTLMTMLLTCSLLRWKCVRSLIPTPSTSQPVTQTWTPMLDPLPLSWQIDQLMSAETGHSTASMVSAWWCHSLTVTGGSTEDKNNAIHVVTLSWGDNSHTAFQPGEFNYTFERWLTVRSIDSIKEGLTACSQH